MSKGDLIALAIYLLALGGLALSGLWLGLAMAEVALDAIASVRGRG